MHSRRTRQDHAKVQYELPLHGGGSYSRLPRGAFDGMLDRRRQMEIQIVARGLTLRDLYARCGDADAYAGNQGGK